MNGIILKLMIIIILVIVYMQVLIKKNNIFNKCSLCTIRKNNNIEVVVHNNSQNYILFKDSILDNKSWILSPYY